jgi:hypothetical protein
MKQKFKRFKAKEVIVVLEVLKELVSLIRVFFNKE